MRRMPALLCYALGILMGEIPQTFPVGVVCFGKEKGERRVY